MIAKRLYTQHFIPAFTIIELAIVIVVVGILAGLVSLSTVSIEKSSQDTARDANVKIISTALEKYYRDNGEYPSVAFMTSQNTAAIKEKLGLVSASVLRLPKADSSVKNSIVTANPSSTRLLYSANTSDSSKNTQCQTDLNGYCDGFQLQYKKALDSSTVVVKSIHDTFTPVAGTATCPEGETQDGNTCTRTYDATYQSGAYTCPSGGSLSGTTCTQTTSASYAPGSDGYYYCPSGGSLSGTTCTTSTTSTYGASSTTKCVRYYDSDSGATVCAEYKTFYTCPSGGSLSGTTCTVTSTSSYGASYSPGSTGYYYCPSGYTQNGTTCTKTYAATQSPGYYYCSDGGTVSGTTCTYSYTLPE